MSNEKRGTLDAATELTVAWLNNQTETKRAPDIKEVKEFFIEAYIVAHKLSYDEDFRKQKENI